MPKPELSIVIPCLNEALSLPFCLRKAGAFLADNNIDGEIIIVDNGSEDNSGEVASSFGAIVTQEPERGYGNAIMAGISKSSGKYIIMGDADDSYDFSAIMPFLVLLRNGEQLVIGNRFKGRIEKNAMPILHRYIGNPVLSFIGRLFFHITLGDFHCGLRGISRDAYDKIGLRTTGMEFASEMIVKAALSGMKITETPVILYPDRRNRPSHLRTWRDGWRHLRFLLLYSPTWLFLMPGAVLLMLGLVSSAVLIQGPVNVTGKTFDIHTLVYTAGAVLGGFQLISFYVFTKVYTMTHDLEPAQTRFLKLLFFFKLERGLALGIILIIIGGYLNLKSFLYWKHMDFGNLNPVKVLRWVIPSVTFILLGLQIIVSCFYVSILTIRSRGAKANNT